MSMDAQFEQLVEHLHFTNTSSSSGSTQNITNSAMNQLLSNFLGLFHPMYRQGLLLKYQRYVDHRAHTFANKKIKEGARDDEGRTLAARRQDAGRLSFVEILCVEMVQRLSSLSPPTPPVYGSDPPTADTAASTTTLLDQVFKTPQWVQWIVKLTQNILTTLEECAQLIFRTCEAHHIPIITSQRSGDKNKKSTMGKSSSGNSTTKAADMTFCRFAALMILQPQLWNISLRNRHMLPILLPPSDTKGEAVSSTGTAEDHTVSGRSCLFVLNLPQLTSHPNASPDGSLPIAGFPYESKPQHFVARRQKAAKKRTAGMPVEDSVKVDHVQEEENESSVFDHFLVSLSPEVFGVSVVNGYDIMSFLQRLMNARPQFIWNTFVEHRTSSEHLFRIVSSSTAHRGEEPGPSSLLLPYVLSKVFALQEEKSPETRAAFEPLCSMLCSKEAAQTVLGSTLGEQAQLLVREMMTSTARRAPMLPSQFVEEVFSTASVRQCLEALGAAASSATSSSSSKSITVLMDRKLGPHPIGTKAPSAAISWTASGRATDQSGGQGDQHSHLVGERRMDQPNAHHEGLLTHEELDPDASVLGRLPQHVLNLLPGTTRRRSALDFDCSALVRDIQNDRREYQERFGVSSFGFLWKVANEARQAYLELSSVRHDDEDKEGLKLTIPPKTTITPPTDTPSDAGLMLMAKSSSVERGNGGGTVASQTTSRIVVESSPAPKPPCGVGPSARSMLRVDGHDESKPASHLVECFPPLLIPGGGSRTGEGIQFPTWKRFAVNPFDSLATSMSPASSRQPEGPNLTIATHHWPFSHIPLCNISREVQAGINVRSVNALKRLELHQLEAVPPSASAASSARPVPLPHNYHGEWALRKRSHDEEKGFFSGEPPAFLGPRGEAFPNIACELHLAPRAANEDSASTSSSSSSSLDEEQEWEGGAGMTRGENKKKKVRHCRGGPLLRTRVAPPSIELPVFDAEGATTKRPKTAMNPKSKKKNRGKKQSLETSSADGIRCHHCGRVEIPRPRPEDQDGVQASSYFDFGVPIVSSNAPPPRGFNSMLNGQAILRRCVVCRACYHPQCAASTSDVDAFVFVCGSCRLREVQGSMEIIGGR